MKTIEFFNLGNVNYITYFAKISQLDNNKYIWELLRSDESVEKKSTSEFEFFDTCKANIQNIFEQMQRVEMEDISNRINRSFDSLI